MQRTQSQNNMILDHLQDKGSITPAEALVSYGCMRLAARILELRESGHRIRTDIRQDGRGVRYARYQLLGGVSA